MAWWRRGAAKRLGKAAISQARSRLGAAALKALWEESAQPVGKEGQPGCFYRGLRLMAVDGSTLDVPQTAKISPTLESRAPAGVRRLSRSCAS